MPTARDHLLWLAATAACGSSAAAATVDGGMAGNWMVDLTAKAGDKPYLKEMRLALGADGQVSGQFHDSPIESGRWTKRNGRTCVSFRTSDGQGPYQTAACLAGERVEGQTWAEHRRFVFAWNAVRM